MLLKAIKWAGWRHGGEREREKMCVLGMKIGYTKMCIKVSIDG